MAFCHNRLGSGGLTRGEGRQDGGNEWHGGGSVVVAVLV